MDYGSSIFFSAINSLLQRLNIIKNQALRLVRGAISYTPISSLHADNHQLPLEFRRRYCILNHFLLLKACLNLLVQDTTLVPMNAPHSRGNSHLGVSSLLDQLDISLPPVLHMSYPALLSWEKSLLKFDLRFQHLTRICFSLVD